ncbi:MAG: polysaccharide export protein [Bryobacteraceae bacterium]|nr:polysaccharide export protein [Bryobacteraceae bacterium]
METVSILQTARRLLAAALISAFFLPSACRAQEPVVPLSSDVQVEAPLAAQAPDAYRMGVGDQISISVLGEPDLSVKVVINDEGSVNYPFLGEIKVLGLSLQQLRERIRSGLAPDYFVDPQVTVQVIQYRNFYVNGEVQKPGGFPWQPGMTVRKAASLAGGFTPRASRSKLTVIRETNRERQPEPVTVDAEVYPGDIITIDQSFF